MTRVHLVRHGEVHNPAGVLYERIPGYHLSAAGERMAVAAAEHLSTSGREITNLIASPLQRAQESAAPVADALALEIVTDEGVIEPWNLFAGKRMKRALLNPLNWWKLRAPARPSWGEPYEEIVARMQLAMDDAAATSNGDAVIVSHQAPIWLTHLAVAGEPLRHDPRQRRCALSSVTSFERAGDRWREVSYVEPASTGGAVDVGAV